MNSSTISLLTRHEPSVEFGAIVAWGAGREVMFGEALPSGDLLERLDRLVPEVLGGLCVVILLHRQGGTVGDRGRQNRTVITF